MNPFIKIRAMHASLIEAQRRSGRSFAAMLNEILRLRWSHGKLGFSEYLDYRLYEPGDFDRKKEFVGWRVSKSLQAKLTHPGWSAISTNKLVFYTMCRGFDLPHPRVYAAYLPTEFRPLGIKNLATPEQLKQFLASPETVYPLFAKPIHAWHGHGGVGLQRYVAATNELVLINGSTISFDAFFRDYIKHEREGYIFQPCLKSHPELVERCGDRLCTMRIWVLLEPGGEARVIRTLWKVAVGNNMIDNTAHGATGNLYGPIEIATGTVLRQIRNAGFDETEFDKHPDTGRDIINFTLPDWSAAMQLCKRAAGCFYGFRIQAWDIALTEQGPMLIELSMPGDIDGPQLAYRKGMHDAMLDQALNRLELTQPKVGPTMH